LGEDLAEAELPAEEGRDGGREADSEEEQEEEVEDRSRGIVWSAWQALCAWYCSCSDPKPGDTAWFYLLHTQVYMRWWFY
jgi:hypothetical protein